MLSGSESAFSIPFAPVGPLSTASPGSKLCFLSPQVLLNSLSGSISAFPSPNTAPVPHSKALPGSQPTFLRPQILPGAACSGCRSGAGARSTQCCRDQRQAAASPALRLRLSLHKVRLRRPLRPLPLSGGRGAKAGLACEMASRSAGVWGGSPSLDSCPDLRTLRLAHRESFASAEPGTSSAIRRPRSESRV